VIDVVALQTRHPPPHTDQPRRSQRRSSRAALAARGAALAASASLLFLVARAGSPLWQLVRFVAAAAVLAAAHLAVTRGGRTRGAATFALGCVAGPVGVGVGLPHVTKTGIGPTAIAGLLSLVGGVVLLAVGGAILLRSVRRWWRAIVAPALLVAVFVSVWTLGQAVAATNVPRTQVGAVTPTDRGLAYRDVTFETADGVTLSGWFVPSTSGAAVVLLHGAGSTRSGVLDHAVVLARRGFGVLLFDARGHGRSHGRAMDFGWYGDEDIAGAVSFLQAQPGHRRIEDRGRRHVDGRRAGDRRRRRRPADPGRGRRGRHKPGRR
jgi:hypothetical protein